MWLQPGGHERVHEQRRVQVQNERDRVQLRRMQGEHVGL
jgi:hypothetical protein